MNPSDQLQTFLSRLTWLAIPLLAVWVSVGYLVGLTRQVDWKITTQAPQVLGMQTEALPIEEIYNWQGNGLVTLWFDDAWYSQYAIAFPLLKKLNLSGALSVPTSLVGGDSYMTWPQIQRVQQHHWEITSHSINHFCQDDKLDYPTIESETSESLNILKQQGLKVETYVIPCGLGSQALTSSIKQRYLSLRTANEGFNSLPLTDPYQLKIQVISSNTKPMDVASWIRNAELQRSWLIIVFHQIGDGNQEYEVTPDNFSRFLDLIIQSDLSIVLPKQAIQATTIYNP